MARAKEETLLGNVNQLRREGQELNEKEIQYSVLQRESDSNQQLYEAVYLLTEEDNGWRVQGVQLVQTSAVGI